MFTATIVGRKPGTGINHRLTVEVLRDATGTAMSTFEIEAATLAEAGSKITERLNLLYQKWNDADADLLFIGKRFAVGDGVKTATVRGT